MTIPTPVLLIKELLDNALDAGATTIAIFVSPNTVDRIEIRDNGKGIHPGDFDSLGRAGYTSKLTTLDELEKISGSSLGFRGIALSSIAAVADVRLTTRTSAEPVAVTLSLKEGGGVAIEGRNASAVGTTVCVTKIFSSFPVRLRATAQEAPKTILHVKELLQSYALARQRIKMVFKVLDTQQSPWLFSPRCGSGIEEVAVQIFGTRLASLCRFYTFPNNEVASQVSDTATSPAPGGGNGAAVVFEAFLPSPGADLRDYHYGAFISVDSRPISSTRGIGRKLLAIYKKKFRQSRLSSLGKTIKYPFMQLNIRCEPGSYDVNVEPAKDDAVFVEEPSLLSQFDSFISCIYCKEGEGVVGSQSEWRSGEVVKDASHNDHEDKPVAQVSSTLNSQS